MSILAMRTFEGLLPLPSVCEQISEDLTRIRETYPEMAAIHPRMAWALGELLFGLTPEAMEQLKKRQYHGLDALNDKYGPVEIELCGSSFLVLRFERGYNADYLSPIYAAAEGVRYAEPNGLLGDGDDITVSGSLYAFSRSWGDCP